MKPLPTPSRLTTLALLSAVLAGCASVPETPAPPAQRDPAQLQLAHDIHLAREGWPAARWWLAYGDPQMDALIDRALAQGPTLAVAAARVQSAHAALRQTQAERGLNTDLSAQANRQRYSGNGLFPPPIGGSAYTDESVQLNAHYDLDWWGRQRAQIAAAAGELHARRAELAMAEQTLAAEVASTYVQWQSERSQQATLLQLEQFQLAQLADLAQRIRAGLGTIDQQRSAEQQLSMIRQMAASTEARAARAREALRALLGDGADEPLLARLQPRPVVPQSTPLPARLGNELLARRPDLQAARWQIEAALSRIEAARAAYYPDIQLDAAVGLDSITLANLLKSTSRTLMLAPALSLPLFDSGRLDSHLAQAASQRDALIADYNRAVINAVRDIAQTAIDLRGTERQAQAQAEALRASTDQSRSARARLAQGLANRAAVLDADIALAREQEVHRQLQTRQVLAQIALIQALGGGYAATATDSPAPAR